jgi:hypothetical protein
MLCIKRPHLTPISLSAGRISPMRSRVQHIRRNGLNDTAKKCRMRRSGGMRRTFCETYQYFSIGSLRSSVVVKLW